MHIEFDEPNVRAALKRAWSLETAVQWTPDTPAAGQCNVTTAVIHDLFGGRILKTDLGWVEHFYNEFDGTRIDLTDSQFDETVDYDDTPSNRTEAMQCVKPSEYDVLHQRLLEELRRSN